jgi:hypothetical protein
LGLVLDDTDVVAAVVAGGAGCDCGCVTPGGSVIGIDETGGTKRRRARVRTELGEADPLALCAPAAARGGSPLGGTSPTRGRCARRALLLLLSSSSSESSPIVIDDCLISMPAMSALSSVTDEVVGVAVVVVVVDVTPLVVTGVVVSVGAGVAGSGGGVVVVVAAVIEAGCVGTALVDALRTALVDLASASSSSDRTLHDKIIISPHPDTRTRRSHLLKSFCSHA